MLNELNEETDYLLFFKGSAASNIGGQTICSSFRLAWKNNFESLSDKNRDKYRNVLQNLRVGMSRFDFDFPTLIAFLFSVIIDEFSMLKADALYQIDLRLREVKQVNQSFGGCAVLLFGDPLQLRFDCFTLLAVI